MPLGAIQLVVTLREMLTLTTFYMLIIMVMFMQNMLVLMMDMLLVLFGSLRPLLLTKEDPLQDGYLKSSNDSL